MRSKEPELLEAVLNSTGLGQWEHLGAQARMLEMFDPLGTVRMK